MKKSNPIPKRRDPNSVTSYFQDELASWKTQLWSWLWPALRIQKYGWDWRKWWR
jgi:hypothetical protein